jgi:predicted dehydrogenase
VKRTRIGIVGLGVSGRTVHLPACAKVPGVDVVGGCDPAVPQGGFRFPLFPSPEELIDKARPDLLVVATPPDSHPALVRLGLEAGCHVLSEKPLAPTLEEADELCALSRKLGRFIVVNTQYRFMNTHQEAKRRIGRPGFGDLLFLSAQQTFLITEETEAGWRGRERRRTCQEFGIHVLDLCRFYFGEEPVSIAARMPKGDQADGPDLLDLIQVEFPGGRAASICLDRLSRGPHRYLEMRLDGSAGCVETRLGGRVEVAAGIRGGARRRPYLTLDVSMGGRARLYHGEAFETIATDPLDVFANATARLLQAFLDALARGGTPPCHAEDHRKSLALVAAAYESDARKTAVEVR